MEFENKIVLVTGGTSGIGLKTVIEFVKHGAYRVITCGRSLCKWEKAKEEFKEKLGEEYRRIKFVQTDVRVESEVERLIKFIFCKYGNLDVCVNNAGIITPPQNIWELDLGKSSKCCDTLKYEFTGENPIYTNLIGLIFCLKWELKCILDKNDPSRPVNIVNIGSAYEKFGIPDHPLYAASKAGVVSLTKSVAGETANLNGRKIVVNSIDPGNTDTPLSKQSFGPDVSPEERNYLLRVNVPMNRVAKPIEIATSILVMANYRLTTYTTGTNLAVDGGLTADPFTMNN